MTALALILAISALPDCQATTQAHRVAMVASAHLAYLVSGIPLESWIAVAEVESNCGIHNDTPLSSALGPWHVIARHLPLDRRLRPALRLWPVNAVAAGVLAKRFQGRCKDNWPACYRAGWAGAKTIEGKGYQRKVRLAERQLRAKARRR